ncbi:MAG: hypothetical protein F6J94_16100 [Moorea sp. SIO1F2]|uniref:hypothetical protein n=1 Tax=unclassified Moorena TaxID=2683338 RepID=UPI0013BAB024|nr:MULTISPECIES: hypothetical protein [unclassified Moorena]NEO17974.1 hypothetical protein [Moorena sp. SIO4A5]NEQ56259.1 hypothetical protein [Moorena sp. SIO4A1]NET83379.1 hypothetical protein [Moorena sp. SIO1F2]
MQRSLGKLNHSLVRRSLFPIPYAQRYSFCVSSQPSAVSSQQSAVAHKLIANS